MVITMTYKSPSGVKRTRRRADVKLAANTKRDEVYFKGRLREPLAFREAIGALHDVVISDLKWRPDPKKKADYVKWRQEQLKKFNSEFFQLQRQYFEYLYKTDRNLWATLDPVITIHPDQIFFECFSKDESTYGRLAARQTMFEGVDELTAGTTNVDFSASLYREMQGLRTYRQTDFTIDPGGIQMATEGRKDFTEKKIDLPESWIRGFLSVQSAMLLPRSVSFDVEPVDVFNVCTYLRRNRELIGPRGLRYELTPGEPVEIVLEPWDQRFVCKHSIYTGGEPRVIRTWGRRRIHLLERLLPLAKKFTVTLLGRGLPTFWHADLGDMVFTLGLSGWTKNDWTGSTNFGLFFTQKSRTEREATAAKALDLLKTRHRASLNDVAAGLNVDKDLALDALKLQCHAGKVMYDFGDDVFRFRPVLREDVALDTMLYRDPREKEALDLVENGKVSLGKVRKDDARRRLYVSAEVQEGGKTYHPELTFDFDGRLITAESDDWFFKNNRLYQGPSTPILAAKIAHERRQSMEEFTD
ncbi:MAG: SWIM zinc finger family protein [Planctomycetota bacterium]